MATKRCLADNGKHRWRHREDAMLGHLRECQKCGVLEQRRGSRYVKLGQTAHRTSAQRQQSPLPGRERRRRF